MDDPGLETGDDRTRVLRPMASRRTTLDAGIARGYGRVDGGDP
jgi:hypothetical protein